MSTYHFNAFYFLSFIILFVFIGFRVGLGRDWYNYERIYNDPYGQDFLLGETREFGFLTLIKWCNAANIDFQGFVLIMIFVTMSLLFFSYKKYIYLLPAAIFIFFTDLGYASIINLMRQTLALFAFMCAMNYSGKKDVKSLLCFFSFLLLGFSFHYTILLFLPCWFIHKLRLSLEQLLIVCISVFLISIMFLADAYEDFMGFVPKYDNAYSNTVSSIIVNEQSTFGLGAMLLLVVRLMPLFYYNIMLKEDEGLAKYFVMYYLGLSVYYGFYNYLLITRFTFYFQFFELIIMPYMLYKSSLFKDLFNRSIRVTFVFLLSFNFIYTYSEFINNHVVNRTFSVMFIEFVKETTLL